VQFGLHPTSVFERVPKQNIAKSVLETEFDFGAQT
jgi:hypothetical protein